MASNLDGLLVVVVLGGVLAAGAATVALLDAPGDAGPGATDAPEAMTTVDDEADFRTYLEAGGAGLVAGGAGGAQQSAETAERGAEAAGADGDGGDGGDGSVAGGATATATPAPQTTAAEGGAGADGGDGPRVGTTNVQVGGVDEPDVLKTDGTHFFYAPAGRAADGPGGADGPGSTAADISVITVEDPASPSVAGRIDASGRLLRAGDHLVVLGRDAVRGIEVSEPQVPQRSWSQDLDGRLVSARLVDGRVYLVLATPVATDDPCPVSPLGGAANVSCDAIHHPREPVRVGAVYTTVALEPATGRVTDATAVVGTRRGTTVYASGDRLYLTYTNPADRLEMIFDLVIEGTDAVPPGVKDEMRSVRDAERSREWKERRVREIYRNWTASMSDQERRATMAAFREDQQAFVEQRRRELVSTGLVSLALREDLPVVAHGSVPGRPLNQFSLSQHEGTLRVATTVPGFGSAESVNDLYTLDAASLERRGEVQGMAPGQEIFAARYVGDTAYLVTFRQVDPFHVVDVSDPETPEELGQVELPGFSTYLHPITDSRILGIGEEDGRVKATVFDASEPADPVVQDDIHLEARFSAVRETHHAFTIDRRHGVFFLPAGDRGVVVDYTDDGLSVETSVATRGGPPQRARYVGDYLYVFGRSELVVLDETDWAVERRVVLPALEP